MKLIKENNLVYYFLFFITQLFFSGNNTGLGQNIQPGKLYIQNYNDKDYYMPENQIWAIQQDKRGIMYFGNNDGILEFDGNYWSFIETSNKSVVRSMAIDSSGTIYFGAKNEFGYLVSDSVGLIQYFSLIKYLPEDQRNFGDVWQTSVIKNKVIFRTTPAIFIVENGQIEIIKPTNRFHTGFCINNQYIVKDRDIGLLQLTGNELVFIEGSELFVNDRVYVILPYDDNKMLIISRQKGIFIYSPDKEISGRFTKLTNANETDQFLISNQVYCGTKLNDEYFILGTIQNGLIIINKKGEIVKHINKASGLLDNSIWNIFIDNNNNIWTGLNTGISYILINSPFTFFDENDGLDGTVYTTYIFNRDLYAGTLLGLYKKNYQDQFSLIQNSKGPSLHLEEIENSLYCGHFEGLIKINKNGINNLAPVGITFKLISYKQNPNYAIAGTLSHGLLLFEKRNGQLHYKYKINGFDEPSRWFEEDNDGTIWVCDEFNGIYHLQFNKELDSVIHKQLFTTEHGLPNNIYNYVFCFEPLQGDKQLLFGTENGIFKFDAEKQKFIPYGIFNVLLKHEGYIDVFKQDNVGNIYFQQGKKKGKLILNEKGVYQVQHTPFSKFDGLIVESITISDQVVYYATKDGIICYNTEYENGFDKSYSAHIRKVAVNDSIVYGGSGPLNKVIEIPFKKTSIEFYFTSTFYEDHEKTKFSFQLEGYDNPQYWSEWSTKSEKEYTNLPEGNYVFKVKARNIFSNESHIAQYSFIILTPWYKTILAYFIYLIFIIFMIIIGFRAYTSQLKASNIKLEKLVKERTSEIELQKEELINQADNIESQAYQLVQTNIELEKLSIVARETDNAITIMDSKGNFEWINHGFTQMYGFSFREFTETVSKSIFESTNDEKNLKILKSCFNEKKSVNYEFKTTTKSGKIVYVQTTITPILNDQNEIKKLISIDTDISKLKKAEKEIIQQRDEITWQKQEITDSILYSKHIQNALFPTQKIINSLLPESFIFFRPKEIIGGDFYWIHDTQDSIVIVVADCTGHGVPGALMSMLGITFLNDIVKSKNITDPGEILDLMRLKIIRTLHQTDKDESTKDGMDIAICTIYSESKKLLYAGANNPVLVFSDNKMNEFKPDKMPVRFSHKLDLSFTTKEKKYESGDMIYLFSDGLADQFGGRDGKRFTTGKLKNFLKEISQTNTKIQLQTIQNTFNKWKGSEEQVDDVLVLGIRL